VLLDGNPRRGDVTAIAAILDEFGQRIPLTGVELDGVKTVLAGNHRIEAMQLLGWTHAAVTFDESTEEEALKFALSDNRISELGSTDSDLLYAMIEQVREGSETFFEVLGWDDFEMAGLEPYPEQEKPQLPPSQGWEPPKLVTKDEEGDLHWEGDEEDERALVTEGSPSAGSGVSGKPNAVAQYTLVFKTPEQQATWYKFINWMKAQPGKDGTETTAELLHDILLPIMDKGDEE